MNKRFEHFMHKVLHLIEMLISILTVVVLLGGLALEIYRIITVNGYFADINNYLHNILTIVVGLEFVRMLVDTTPSNILEVLTVAITRHVILTHDNPWSNLACVVCVGILFATRRFLIRRNELKEELVENE